MRGAFRSGLLGSVGSPIQATFSVLPGGKYAARQNDDGTWDILDVPVFTTIAKGVKNAPRDITSADLDTAVNVHERQYREDKFLARTNVLHNYGLFKATPAGFFLPKRVQPMRFKSQTRPVIFADLLAVPDPVFREIDRHGLPYCSVEVRTYEPLTFGALALLDTEPPFFEFPLLSIGNKEFATAFEHTTEGTVALAHFNFEEGSMPDEKKPDEKPPEGEKKDKQFESGNLKEAVAQVMEALKPISELIAAMKDLGDGGEEEPPAESTEGPVDEPVAAMKADDPKLLGRISALEDYRDRAESEKTRDALFSAAVTALEADGYSLSDNVRARLRTLAAKGEDVLESFTDSYRETAVQDPPDRMLTGAPGERFPAEVMSFAAQSSEKFKAAQDAYREWRTFPDDKFRTPLDKYLKREVI